MQVRPTIPTIDPDRRGLVLARLDTAGEADLLRAAKDAVGEGADLVVVPTAATDACVTDNLASLGIGWVAAVDTEHEAALAAERGAAMIRWNNLETALDERRAAAIALPWLVPAYTSARPEDAWLLPVEALDGIAVAPEGVQLIVDLGDRRDRAALAALVAVALEAGAVGFITVAPKPVRRAAHVIRAVERAR